MHRAVIDRWRFWPFQREVKGRADGLGGAFVAVDPRDERLVERYGKLGFLSLDSNKRRVVLPLR